MSRKRQSKVFTAAPGGVGSLGKVLAFESELFGVDSTRPRLAKRDVHFDSDYLILKGDYSGRVARCVSTKAITLFGKFKDTRNTEIRVKIEKGFGTVPVVNVWDEPLDVYDPNYERPPILLIQSRSIVGAPLQKELLVCVREGPDLVAQFTYRKDVMAECVQIPKLEETLYDLAAHKKAHPSLYGLNDTGYWLCYEDDGWLLRCTPGGRVRFFRRSHVVSVTICRCGRDLMDALFDDVTLRMLLPCRHFVGKVGLKVVPRMGTVKRRTSSIIGPDSLGFDLSDLLEDFDHSMTYKRIFTRRGAVTGNFLVQDSQFMDAVRSWIDNGGLSRRAVVPNVVKWRHMIKSAAAGDDPYLLFEDVRIVGAQWYDALEALPNSKFRPYSFSCVYYNATVKIDGAKVAHKALQLVRPKVDIGKVFERQILMNGGYFVLAVSRKGVADDKLHVLFNNLEQFVHKVAKTHAYKTKRIAMGVHYENMVFMDFRVYRRFTRSMRDFSRMYADDAKYDPDFDGSYAYHPYDDDNEEEHQYYYEEETDKDDHRWIYC